MANLLSRTSEIHKSLKGVKPKVDLDILNNLNESTSLLELSFPRSPYKVFHFRSPLVEEGRTSPLCLGDTVKDVLIKDKYSKIPEPDKINYNVYVNNFFKSLLNSYLYIFGRDVSFSENCILHAERKNDTSGLANTHETITLTIKSSEESSTPSIIGHHIIIPYEYYQSLTQSIEKNPHCIPVLIINAVLECMSKNNSYILNSISDYRKALHLLENSLKNKFSKLQNRGIEVALYQASQEDSESEIAKSFSIFYKYVNIEEDEESIPNWSNCPEKYLRFFFRVVQAASVFTFLLDENLSVTPFPTYYCNDYNQGPLATALSVAESWEKLRYDTKELLNENNKSKFYSSIVVYWSSRYGAEDNMKENLILALSCLSPFYFSLGSDNDLGSKNYDNILGSYFKYTDNIEETEKTEKTLESKLGDNYFWPIIALAGADTLRGIKHESQGASVNLAIGTDVEFREVLTPIFSITKNQEAFQMNNLADLRKFQKYLRCLIKRHFYLINVPNRYICIKVENSGSVRIHNISDLRNEYHASTFSEIVRNVIPKSGLTIARTDSFGKANIFSRTKDRKHKLIFKCDAHDYWTDIVSSDNGEHSKYLSDVSQDISNLKADSWWKNFVEDILMPTVEIVSENPLEGAAIVVAKMNDDIKNAIAEMPGTGKFEIDPNPTNEVQYVDKETFKRHLIQDGATILYYDKGIIQPRIQLKGRVENFRKILDDNAYLKEKASMWGTRHLSCLHFIGEMQQKTKKVFCIVISQDGEVHYMRSDDNKNICKSVMFG